MVGIEATGSMGWFVRLMEELGITCRVGHPAMIRKAETRRQKHDRRDANLLLTLLVEDRFPAIWMPATECRDLRTLLLHRHQWVRMRTRVQNALHAIALGQGLRRGPTLWSQGGQAVLAALPLPTHAAHRRDALQALYRHVNAQVDRLDAQVKQVAGQRPQATLLMTHPGVGHVTALATEVFLGDPSRFRDGKALARHWPMSLEMTRYPEGGNVVLMLRALVLTGFVAVTINSPRVSYARMRCRRRGRNRRITRLRLSAR